MSTRILIIRFSALGDVILTSPTVLNCKLAFPDSEITFLTKEQFKPIVELMPGVDHTATIPKGGGAWDLFRTLRDLDHDSFDYIVDLHGNARSMLSRKLLPGGIPVKYPKPYLDRWLMVRKHDKQFPERYIHTIDRYNDTLRQINQPIVADRPLLNRPGPSVTSVLSARPSVLIGPGAAHPTKRWPVERFAEVAEQLINLRQVKILWAYTSNDSGAHPPESIARHPSVELLIDEPLIRLAERLVATSLAITNDSGLSHLASALGVPVMALFGPTHPALGFEPRGLLDRVIETEVSCRPCSRHGKRPCWRTEQFCFTRIQSDDVVDPALALFDRSSASRPGLLLDRDGTVIANKHYLSDPEQVELLPGAAELIREANRLGLPIAIISNQSGVARGYFDESRVELINQRVREVLREQGARVDRFYYSPYHPTAATRPEYARDSRTRKPRPGMAEQAAIDLEIDLRRSLVVGDSPADLDLARVVGARPCLVRTGYGEDTERGLGNGFNPVIVESPSALRPLLGRL